MDKDVIVTIITAFATLIGAFLMALPGIRAFRNQQKKSNAEVVKVEAETTKIYSDLLTDSIQREVEKSEKFSMLKERIDTLEHELREVVTIVCSWANGINTLVKQVEVKGDQPEWTPNCEDIEKIKALKDRMKPKASS